MARQSRLVVPDVVHHVVARGVDGLKIFRDDQDKERYLKRAALIAVEEKVKVHGYCLMDNHVHLLLTPTTPKGLARFFSRLHTWWAMIFNRRQNRKGHLFQCRYFSSPLSECHYLTALQYVERNAVRAKLVSDPAKWTWSSARYNLGLTKRTLIPLTPVCTRRTVTPQQWREILQTATAEADEQLRRAHRSSRPCGPFTFLRDLELKTGRKLIAKQFSSEVLKLTA